MAEKTSKKAASAAGKTPRQQVGVEGGQGRRR